MRMHGHGLGADSADSNTKAHNHNLGLVGVAHKYREGAENGQREHRWSALRFRPLMDWQPDAISASG